ncbi:GNAT family N-acetyltransferase [Granulicoccus phenolivorans]|uniref:GNAT family N-acetyltransferase n=1 Tax=Granulicoccus phenolivorans TaxID=266854 RepID=UPI0004225F28|nr:GNAT family N-acetyltransferase [Granulicoccus phenolivorans]
MKIVKTRDADVAKRAAEIWALATTKRDAEVADIDQVELSQAAPLIQRVLDDSDRSFLVALTVTEEDSDYAEESENPTLAFMALSPSQEEGAPATRAELRFMGVAPGHWGEGWARRMLVALPDMLRESGFTEAVLWVHADNIRAIWVYEALGWVATRRNRPNPTDRRIEGEYRLDLS